MKNRFSGKCYRCGHIVPAGSGETNRNKATGLWQTEHINDQCKPKVELKGQGFLRRRAAPKRDKGGVES